MKSCTYHYPKSLRPFELEKLIAQDVNNFKSETNGVTGYKIEWLPEDSNSKACKITEMVKHALE